MSQDKDNRRTIEARCDRIRARTAGMPEEVQKRVAAILQAVLDLLDDVL